MLTLLTAVHSMHVNACQHSYSTVETVKQPTSSPGRFSLAFPAPPPKPGKRSAPGTRLSGRQILSRRCRGEGCDTKNIRLTLSGDQVDNADSPLMKLTCTCEISIFAYFFISSHKKRKIKSVLVK